MNTSILHHTTEHVFWLAPDESTDRPLLGIVTGTSGTLMVEAGNSPTHAHIFLNEIARLSIDPPSFLTATHWHWDHVFGASVIEAPFIAHRKTRSVVADMSLLDWNDAALDRRVTEGREIEFCRDMIKKEFSESERIALDVRPPDIAFTSRIDIDLGGVSCQLIHVGGDHGDDSSIVYVPEDKLIFLGDCLYENYYGGLPPYYTTRKLFPLLDQLLDFHADFYLAAHSNKPMSNTEMLTYAERLKTIGSIVEQIGPECECEATVSEVQQRFHEPLSDDDREIIEAFRTGLSLL